MAISINAQKYEKLRNQQFEVVEFQKNNTTIYAQGDPIVFYSERKTTTQFIVTAVLANKYTLQFQTNHIDGKLIAFGKEQVFNSDDTASNSNKDSANVVNLIKQSSSIVIDNNQPQKQKDTALSMVMIIQDDPSKYYLPLSINQLQLGYSWTDSTIEDNNKSVNQYIITKKNTDSIELTVYKEIQKKAKLSQEGKLVEQQLKGFASSTRWYNVASQLLQSEYGKISFSGTTSMGDQSLPISITIQTTVQLFPKNKH